MSFNYKIFIFLVAITAQRENSVCGSDVERKLLEYLLGDNKIDTRLRPVLNYNDNITVRIAVTLMRIVSLDEERQHIELNIWKSLEWNDTYLKWEPEKYDGIKSIRISTEQIWVPDIYIYNQVSEEMDPFHKTLAIVQNTGNVRLIKPGFSTTTCDMDLTNYPFEVHECSIKFGSWTASGEQIDLLLGDGDLHQFNNTEWEVLGFPGKRTAMYYSCCPEPYLDVTFNLQLKRKGEAILSCARQLNAVILGLAFLSCLFMPSSSFKIVFGIFAITLSIYCSWEFNPVLGKRSPPLLAKYFANLFVLCFCVLFANVVIYCTFSKNGSVPILIKKLLDKCPINRPHEIIYNDLQQLNSDGREEIEISDWKYLAILVDRFFFVLWLLVLPIFYLAAFPSFDY